MSESIESRARFDAYADQLVKAVGHADRRAPLTLYCQGLILPGDRKSIEPMAARLDPAHVQARHQSLHHLVAQASWSDEAVLRVVRSYAREAMEIQGPIEAWIVDDTAFPKKGTHSVGVGHQYCGPFGKTANCQNVVSLSMASRWASVPVGFRLYLPEAWANDRDRRDGAGVPKEVVFMPKWQIALALIDAQRQDQVPDLPVLADAGYGDCGAFREALSERNLVYAVGIAKTALVWANGNAPLPARGRGGKGRPGQNLRRDDEHQPVSVKALAESTPKKDWQRVVWGEGTRGLMESRFVALRVHSARRGYEKAELRPEEWLLIEWPEKEAEPTKYWLSTLPSNTPIAQLVRTTKLRWRIERDYQEMKDELGLDHYEGRGWRGLHHHLSLCAATYAFIVAERSRLSPPTIQSIFEFVHAPPGARPLPRGHGPVPA
ncbi:IS701 family transposase [Mesoterricola sediminis]|uniref:DDE transposase n=1 Tax=Mesoterricola sediminis TaxID=2927980 RepID=A0AA48KCN3_9BACT|nr:IS701 family transposase [Mesoterricola sediminis]BDU76763.1 DDE transposase [Mesoterricola sediminis]BDU77271.1 DDE transposase [Mesoterricola sediminis]